jgi:glutamate-1-semialdehyde aminotransferase
VVGAGSLFRVLLTDRPIRNYRDSVLDAAPGHPSGTTVPLGTPPPERLARLHLALLDEGVVIANNGLGCLSTPMTDAEVDYFVQALERAILRTR